MRARRGQRRFRGLTKPKTRRIPLTDEMVEALKQQAKAFEAKFDRAPGPNDPIFFDPESDVPEPMKEWQIADYEATVGDTMRRLVVDPAIIYAFEKVGFLANEKNWPLLDPLQRQEWLDAIAEYRAIPED